jgi:hypothetical protein
MSAAAQSRESSLKIHGLVVAWRSGIARLLLVVQGRHVELSRDALENRAER